MLSQWAPPPPPVLSDEGAGRVLTSPLHAVHDVVHDAMHGAMHDAMQSLHGAVHALLSSAAARYHSFPGWRRSRLGAATLGASTHAAQTLSRVGQSPAHWPKPRRCPNIAGSSTQTQTSAPAFPPLGTPAADAQQQRTVARLTGSSMASTFDELDQLAALMRKRSALSSQRRPGTAGPAGAGGNAHLLSRERPGGERSGGNAPAEILMLP